MCLNCTRSFFFSYWENIVLSATKAWVCIVTLAWYLVYFTTDINVPLDGDVYYYSILFFHFAADYGDVSGLPDPFHGTEVVDNSGGQKSHPMQHMTFEESLGESGYSTPNSRNRRIIREIIVWFFITYIKKQTQQ
mgnify:CR=1 FL=1